MVNSGRPDFFLSLLHGLQILGASIRRLLPGPTVIDTMELVCGMNYTDQQAESVCRAGWAVDAIHPTAHTFAKMALNLMEKITPGVRGRETPRPLPPPPPPAPPPPPPLQEGSEPEAKPLGRPRGQLTAAPNEAGTGPLSENRGERPHMMSSSSTPSPPAMRYLGR
jgi:hypothetical protein